jgi:hypothetical protein
MPKQDRGQGSRQSPAGRQLRPRKGATPRDRRRASRHPEGATTDDEEDFLGRLRALAKEFVALPDDDQARLAYVDRVERLLDEPKLSGQLRAAPHGLAAEALLKCSADGGAAIRDRLVKHLDCAETHLRETGVSEVTHLTRAHAFLRFGVNDSSGVRSPSALAAAAQAFDGLLRHRDGNPAQMGPLAYNGAMFLVRHLGLPQQDAEWERLQALLRFAYDQYVSTQSSAQATDAAVAFTQIVADRMERSSPSDQKRNELFAEAWPLVNYVTASTSAAESPSRWAKGNEVAAALVQRRPGFSSVDNAHEAINYLDRALLAYQDIGNHEAAAACAARIAGAMALLPPPWSVRMVARLEHYLRLGSRLHDDTRPLQPAALFALANAWAKAPASEVPGGYTKIRAAAEEAFAAASHAGDNDIAAYSQILIGNSLLKEAGVAELNAGKDHLTPSDCGLLERACGAFQRASKLAVASGNSAAQVQAMRELGAALGRRITHCDSPHLVDHALSTLRRALALSVGDDRVVAAVNLAGLTLEAVRRGLGSSPQALQEVVDEVGRLRPLSDDPRVEDAYKALSDALEEYELGASPKGAGGDDIVAPGSPLKALAFAAYNCMNVPLADRTRSALRITLRLLLEKQDQSQGEMRLERNGPTVNASFSAPCPSCQVSREWSLPFIVSFDTDPAAAQRLEEMARGDAICANCGTALQYQFAFTAHFRQFHQSFVIVYPDIWAPSMGAAARQQARLAAMVHQSWTEEPIGDLAIPWSAVQAMTVVNAEWARSSKRDLALRLVVLGVLGTDALVRQGLELDPGLWQTAEGVEAGRLRTILGPDFAALGQPVPDVMELVRLINGLLAIARQSGIAAALEQVRRAHQARSVQISAFESALGLAGDVEQRRNYLRALFSQTPDYSSERSQALYEMLLLGSELELRSMEERGVAKGSPEYRAALALVEGARTQARETIERDRKVNSSHAAKQLILESLAGSRKFVLLLRAFSLEGDPRAPSAMMEQMAEGFGKPNVALRVFSFGEPQIERIATAAAQESIVMIVNVLDWRPPHNVEKLFASNQDWQKLAFALMPEAAAIIFVLPTDRSPSPGVMAEIAALQRLGSVDRTVVVLSQHGNEDMAGLFTQPKPQADAVVPEWSTYLRDSGFRIVFAEEDINRDPALLAAAVRDLMDRPAV